jgi:hypothetical protein
VSNNQGAIHSATTGGVVGTHPASSLQPFPVGSATGNESNLIRFWPRPLVCWKVEDVRFAFDSSFVTFNTDPKTHPEDTTSDPLALPFTFGDIRDELKLLASQIQQNPGCPLAVWGHADPVGPAVDPDGYNKALSGRRATSIYALLISATEPSTAAALWQAIAVNPNEHWGSQQMQIMQQATGLPNGTPMNSLIRSYIPKLIPPEYSALQIGPSNFLAQGADSKGKGDYQGCSSFNPLIIFSQEKEDSFANATNDPAVYEARNLANAPNRRVMVLLFQKGSKVDPNKWPCPRASDDKSGCIKRFWSDGDTRRFTRLPAQDRKYSDSKDTFACRFYDRLMNTSSCYQELVPLTIRLINVDDEIFKNQVYNMVVGSQTFSGQTSEEGIINVLVPATATAGTLKLPKPNWTVNFQLQPLEASSDAAGAQARLNNLGYFASRDLNDNLDDQTQRSLDRFEVAHIAPIGFSKDPQAQADNQDVASASEDEEQITPQVSSKLTQVYGC